VGDALVISDWKKARSRLEPGKPRGWPGAVALYAELAKDFAPGKPVMLEFVHPGEVEGTSYFDRHLMPVNPAQIIPNEARIVRKRCGGRSYPPVASIRRLAHELPGVPISGALPGTW